ncbi:MAG: HD domain-containing protein [Gemmataceae bacterium]|nr:HD domain-containing protein [Gemmataceae bacterium]
MSIDEIFRLFLERGASLYFGERVTQTEHALQCAALAERERAGADLIAAALLHDIGHLLHALPEDIAERGIDSRHEAWGAAWLAGYFGPAVVDPIRMHVAAKRYLCATEPAYMASLSAASRLSLDLQGGPFSPTELAAFEQEPHFRSALALRRWDDAAKVPGLALPGLEHYRSILDSVWMAQG